MENDQILKNIHGAIEAGNLVRLTELIGSEKSRLNMNTGSGTWLHAAAEFGEFEIVMHLVELGIDINIKGGSFDCNALSEAAFFGYLKIVKFLFHRGSELNIETETSNPLFLAIGEGHSEIAKFLVENGIDVKLKYNGKDAYDYACETHLNDIADLLAPTDGTPRPMLKNQFEVEELNSKDKKALREGERAALKILSLTSESSNQLVHEQIDSHLDNLMQKSNDNSENNIVMALAALWSNRICSELNWKWWRIKQGGWSSLGICDPEKWYLALPLHYFDYLSHKHPDEITLMPLLLYKCIREPKLPHSEPGAFTIITESN